MGDIAVKNPNASIRNLYQRREELSKNENETQSNNHGLVKCDGEKSQWCWDCKHQWSHKKNKSCDFTRSKYCGKCIPIERK